MSNIHITQRPAELAYVDTPEGELAARGLRVGARRRGERDADFVRADQALHEGVVGDRWDARGRVRGKGACEYERNERPLKAIGMSICSLPHVKPAGPMLERSVIMSDRSG